MANRLSSRKRSSSLKKSQSQRNRNARQKINTGARNGGNHPWATEIATEVGVAKQIETKSSEPAAVPAQITLRPFSVEDQPFILQVTREEMGPIFQESYGYELNLENVMQYVHSSQTRMITVNDQLAGYVSVLIDDGGKMNVGSLILSKSHKRQGYGTRIMKLVEQEARGMGLAELEAFVQSSNQASINFLKKLGFQEVPSMQPQTVVMVKNLQSA